MTTCTICHHEKPTATPVCAECWAEQGNGAPCPSCAELREELDALKASIHDLSHPNCQMLLRDKERTEAERDRLREEVARLTEARCHCLITGHEVGTDTRPVGQPCECANCVRADRDRLREALVTMARREATPCNGFLFADDDVVKQAFVALGWNNPVTEDQR